ncbi:four helix bundle protein [Puniceicoccus vermicola]|uniref:Four helix bundle protein n=1 Tax=Puniceicoccus vermicola TaxID=388746 RepID=A0A7X1E4U7_9BACT|nr:four helix bundle protein [Puniceicoccus vermicola]MBC2602388.1 four helix bundle protein [Puniceicoccus vermicola]
MSSIQRFEEIEAWKESRILARITYEICKSGELAKDFALRDQVRRSAVSVGSNIAEGFGRGSNQEFIRFLRIALGSAYEFRSQAYTLLDANYIDKQTFSDLLEQSEKVANLIGGFLRYLESIKQ